MQALIEKPRWEYSLQELKSRSPSGRDGITWEDELLRQSRGVRFIAGVGEQLKLPPMTIYTAITYMHRFYLRNSHKKVHCFEAASACVFLASKTEETMRKLQEVATACTRIALKNPKMPISDTSSDMLKWKGVITYNEEILLEALYFDLDIPSPYQALKAHLLKIGVTNLGIEQSSTHFINDSCKTMLGSIYPSDVLAAGAIFWAADHLKVDIPDINSEPWYISLGYTREQLVSVVNTMVDMISVVKKGQNDGIKYQRIDII